jgi:hypothetical protein
MLGVVYKLGHLKIKILILLGNVDQNVRNWFILYTWVRAQARSIKNTLSCEPLAIIDSLYFLCCVIDTFNMSHQNI